MMTLIEGKMNSGKTLCLTYFAIKDYLDNRKIITNYNINLPHYEINKDFLSWLSTEQPDTKGMSFFFDELWLWALDSRSSMTSKLLTYFFLQSSKGDTKIYMTTQKGRQIDVRVRENSHVIIDCKRYLLIGNKFRLANDRIRDLGSKWYPYIYIKIKEYDPSTYGLYDLAHPKKTYYIKADWLFKFYNTDQKMKPSN